MRLKFKWILSLLVALSMQFSFAQEKTVSGTVTDASGPIPGVNVVVKGKKTGIQTDFDGKFAISAKTGDVLVFSFVGMEDKSVAVGASNVINVRLASSSQALDEVVVVAYGTQKAKAIVGSVVTVGKEVLEKQQATSVLTALQGSVAGVNIIAAGGQPGENPTIRIRGIGSINASAEPLIVLDGAPFSGNLNTISSDQIESISVLKDASSTALYGSRGSNGVILITTKRGRLASPPRVTASTLLGFAGNAVKLHDLVGSDTYIKYAWEGLRNANQYVSNQTAAVAGANASNQLVGNLGYNPYAAAVPVDANGNLVTTQKKWETNWEDLMLNNSAVRKEHTFGVSGGSDNTSYAFTTNYLSQEGSVVTSNFDRVTTRLSIDSQISKSIKAGITAFYSTSSQNFPTQSGSSFQSAVQWIYTIPSYYPVYRRDNNGDLIVDGRGNNIFDYGANNSQILNGTRPQLNNENAYGALFNYKIENKRDNFTANAYVEFTLAKDLTFKTNLAYDKYLFDSYNYANNEVGFASSVNGRVTQNRDITTSTNLINSLNYKKSFGNHNFAGTIIQEAYKYEIDALGAQGEGFLPGVYVLDGSTTPSNVSGSTTEERISSYLGRLTYNFKEKYFLEGSYRRDGSSRFNSDVRWGNFYAVGASWLISEENFLKNSSVVDLLKLKGSYGELGNNRLASYFPYRQLFNTGWNELENTGVVLGGAVDTGLTWEKTASSNIGLEYGLFNNRISGTVDYYSKESVDLIYGKPIPGSTGTTSITTNIGSIKNSGWEFAINTRNIATPNFLWTTGLNFSFDRNEITELPSPFNNGNKKWEVGRSLYEFFIQDWAGVDPATGYGMWYKDVLGTNGLPTGERVTTKVYSEATRYYVGKSSLPDVVGGFTNFFKYKNVDMNILFNFSFGSYVYDSTYASLMEGFESSGRAAHTDLINRWQQPGDITNVPLFLTSNNDFNAQSTRFLFKNDYIRLKALNIGYNFPKSLVERVKLSKLRMFLQADNVFTFQSHKGIDPEQDLNGATNSRSYNQRIVSFGLNLEF
ncbi:MAG: TonB-dependent receptor [Flavobacteriaceae bacterium]|jgi:TonB-linked SusC/RagA family outer membrane protein|uniref:TonB-dependent receptor n=1 Tax=Flavobacterium kayseriense TaxID=2764714 RepID=A0ABR7J2U9_9FLAO|nr:TonB-dependent receptor [Flavobacterium kayseriense]MBC5839884.1 TonB-dependent receptor [Flavobacterium kayseriense]MBC5847446.1 TonB-dependent receptor [Flavobacterium kayseriense]MBU0940088.1 TonB-dependent receptor [Bacteroidota bacterium]MBX9889302.1 TonB-dependent receptor [Flavobacteriaceae bacterium]